jgi:hypothetical protein
MTDQTYDLGTEAYFSTSLPTKVATLLRTKYQLLDKLDLQQQFSWRPIWAEEQFALNYKTLASYFSQYTYLPRLANSNVLKAAVIQGVQDGQYSLAAGSAEGSYSRVYHDEDLSSAFES